ncbi:acylphosphatase-like protein (plasmid) [Rhizobium etli 8C-3]|uniref:Acylphosphatase-like protein n=3 Tax=Rhizobium/Agrobacterium group TaxID=227290 RepID=A0A1L5PH83_RHIET|nr:acylphosphatase-like protein [Rhizobium etli 8C-3]TCU37922.1 hypothetical protein EV129_105240 [Rhizobium azibense]
MTDQCRNHFRERMTILGELDAVSFIPWVRRHAAKLGLAQAIAHTSSERLEVDIAGPVELIDMMEIACLLGPIDVWVETIHRTPIDRGTG